MEGFVAHKLNEYATGKLSRRALIDRTESDLGKTRVLADHNRIEREPHTNPKRERGMLQVTCGAAPVPSLTLRVSIWDDSAI